MSKFTKVATPKKESNTLSNYDPDTIAVFDGDELVYGIGFSCEERLHQATNPLDEKGVAHFKNKTTMQKFLTGITLPEGFEFKVEDIQKPEPLANALNTVKNSIQKVCNTLKAGSYEVYLGGKDNFRDTLPLPKKYKDRENLLKPKHYSEIIEYLSNHHDAIFVNGREADDAITSRMYDGYKGKKKIVAVSRDKDARMASGWLLNATIKDSKPEYIEGLGEVHMSKHNEVKGTSRKFFYAQCLVGDGVDTYNPRDLVELVKGERPAFGAKACFNLLDPCTTDKECLQVIVDKYREWFGDEEFTYTDIHGNSNTMDWTGALQLYVDCAWMQRWEGDQLDIMKVIKNRGVSYESSN